MTVRSFLRESLRFVVCNTLVIALLLGMWAHNWKAGTLVAPLLFGARAFAQNSNMIGLAFLTQLSAVKDFNNTGTCSSSGGTCYVNLNQNASTYTLGTATGGDVWVMARFVNCYVQTTATGGTSWTLQTNNTTADLLIASTTYGNTTSGKNLGNNLTTMTRLPSGGTITYTIVGTGSAGVVYCTIPYVSLGGSIQ